MNEVVKQRSIAAAQRAVDAVLDHVDNPGEAVDALVRCLAAFIAEFVADEHTDVVISLINEQLQRKVEKMKDLKRNWVQ